MKKWLNNKRILRDWEDLEKPCHKLGFCPYGVLVEKFPLHPERKGKLKEIECEVFGHDCPVFYLSEDFSEVKGD